MSATAHMFRHVRDGKDIEQVYKEVKRKYALLVEKAHTWTVCVQCGEQYKPAENMIQRTCWMHPGALKPHPFFGGIWTCCGAHERITGCVSCMHTDSPALLESMIADPTNSFVELPQEALDFALVRFNPRIIENYPEGGRSIEGRRGKFYHIRRVVV